MENLKAILDLFLHLQDHLKGVVEYCGPWSYAVLFLIIFCETGLVITPFLPGDSLLFASGAFAALYPDQLNLWVLLVVLTIAAILGDTVNYALGRWIGPVAFSGKFWFLKKEHLDRTQAFYEKHGGKTIILARFVPIVRTFAPFVAGVGVMNYGRFLVYNIVGGIAWVLICTGAGYFFGNFDVVKKNFELVVVGIVVVSVIPVAWELAMSKKHAPVVNGEPSLVEPSIAETSAENASAPK